MLLMPIASLFLLEAAVTCRGLKMSADIEVGNISYTENILKGRVLVDFSLFCTWKEWVLSSKRRLRFINTAVFCQLSESGLLSCCVN